MQGHPDRNGPADVVINVKPFANGKSVNQAVDHDAHGSYYSRVWGVGMV